MGDDELRDILSHPSVEFVESVTGEERWVKSPIRLVTEPTSGYGQRSCCESLVADALGCLERCGVQATSIAEGIAILYRQRENYAARIRELEMTMTHHRELTMDW